MMMVMTVRMVMVVAMMMSMVMTVRPMGMSEAERRRLEAMRAGAPVPLRSYRGCLDALRLQLLVRGLDGCGVALHVVQRVGQRGGNEAEIQGYLFVTYSY